MDENPYQASDVANCRIEPQQKPGAPVLHAGFIFVTVACCAIGFAELCSGYVNQWGDKRLHGFGAAVGGFLALGAILLFRLLQYACSPPRTP